MEELSIVPFRYKLLPALHDMLQSQNYQGISDINMNTIPKIGYMVLMNGHPIAAGFLRKLEGGLAHLDGLTSNAYFGSVIRHKAIELVVDTLIKEAKLLKLKGIIATTKDDGILKRAISLGFHVVPDTVISLKL